MVYRSASRSSPQKRWHEALMNCAASKEMSAVRKKTPMDNKTFPDIDTYSIYMACEDNYQKRILFIRHKFLSSQYLKF